MAEQELNLLGGPRQIRGIISRRSSSYRGEQAYRRFRFAVRTSSRYARSFARSAPQGSFPDIFGGGPAGTRGLPINRPRPSRRRSQPSQKAGWALCGFSFPCPPGRPTPSGRCAAGCARTRARCGAGRCAAVLFGAAVWRTTLSSRTMPKLRQNAQ